MSWLSAGASVLSPYKWAAIGVVVAALVGYDVYLWFQISELETKVASWKGMYEKEHGLRLKDREEATAATLKISEDYREKERMWNKSLAQTQALGEQKVALAEAAVVRSNALSGSLRDRIAALKAASSKAASDPSASPSCKAAAESTDLLGRMFQRIDQDAGGIAAYADKLRIGFEACVSSYNALRVDTTNSTTESPAP